MNNTILLPRELNINSITDVIEEAKKIISVGKQLALDAKNVETTDALGLQLILAIGKTAGINNTNFQLINVSDELKKYLDMIDKT